MEAEEEVGSAVPTFRAELGTRLSSVLDLYGTRVEAARVAEVTAEQLAKYVAGAAKPPFEVLARLARPKRVSLDWLATGEGAMRREADEGSGVDLERLRVVIEAFEGWRQENKASATPKKYAEAVVLIYKLKEELDGDMLRRLFNLIE